MNNPMAGRRVHVLMPVFNDWQSANRVLIEIDSEISGLGASCSVTIVDDGSTNPEYRDGIFDLSLQKIDQITELRLIRNMGNQKALAVGIAYVGSEFEADYLVVMDSDLEDKPSDIPRLLSKCAETGDTQIVFAKRTKRSEGRLFRIYYKLFQALFRLLTHARISAGNFSVIPWGYVNSVASLHELWNHYSISLLRSRLPYCEIPSERGKRLYGTGTMNVTGLTAHAFSGLALYSDIIAIRLIFFFLAIGVLLLTLAGVVVGIRLFTDIPLIGWTSIALGLMSILVVQMVTSLVMLLFQISMMRTQAPHIPRQEFRNFIASVSVLFKKK